MLVPCTHSRCSEMFSLLPLQPEPVGGKEGDANWYLPPWFCCALQGSHTHTCAHTHTCPGKKQSCFFTIIYFSLPKCLMIKSQLNTGTKTRAFVGS